MRGNAEPPAGGADTPAAERTRMLRRCGVCFQAGGLWISLTLA